MRDLEIDLNDPYKPILWVKGRAIKMYGWKKIDARTLISSTGHSGRKKESAKGFYKDYGVPASTCAKYLNSGLIKMSVGAVEAHRELCYRQGRFSSFDTIKVCEMKDELDRALADGIRHITPFIAQLKMTPKELKLHLGNANWKAICKNSFTRNKGIAETYTYFTRTEDGEKAKPIPIESLLQAPSTIFKYQNLSREPEIATYLNKKCKITISEIHKLKNRATWQKWQIIRDTERMAKEYEQSFSFDWSWRKMQEKHDEFARIGVGEEAKRLKAENEKYSLPLREGKKKIWGFNGVVATFLDTYERILEEGAVMHHCVGSFARWCYEDSYAVIHLEGDGEKTTLGIHITPSGSAHFSQHYGISNSHVKSDSHKMLANLVIEELNKESWALKSVVIKGIIVNE